MNKNFISAEEFLKQNKKVQETLIKWWKPQTGDLIYNTIFLVINYLDENYKEVSKTYKEFLIETNIPLLQMHQLIDFIEETTKKDLSHWRDIDDDEFTIYLTNKKLDGEYGGYTIINQQEFKEMGLNLLDALWQVVIKIVE